MSASTLACTLVDAMAPMLQAVTEAIGAITYVQWYPASDACPAFWNVSIHSDGVCYSGIDYGSPSAALLKAVEKLQSRTLRTPPACTDQQVAA